MVAHEGAEKKRKRKEKREGNSGGAPMDRGEEKREKRGRRQKDKRGETRRDVITKRGKTIKSQKPMVESRK